MAIDNKIKAQVDKARKHEEDLSKRDPLMTGMLGVPLAVLALATAVSTYQMSQGAEVSGNTDVGYDSGLVETMTQEEAYAAAVAYD